jgi:hypothetical protein
MNAQESKLHKELLEIGKNEHYVNGCANILKALDVNTIIATLEYFSCDSRFLQQCHFDLSFPCKYRVFDWLAMCISGRWAGYGENKDELNIHKKLITKFAEIYLECNGNSLEFVNVLRTRDLELEINFND